MELRAHDIIRINDISHLSANVPQPDWVYEALKRTPYVVVRRAAVLNERIPVGVRGGSRNERYAAYVPNYAVEEHITPESLANTSLWAEHRRFQQMKALQALPLVGSIFTSLNMQWGPTGSVGFELACGYHSVHADSDLDVIIRVEKPPSLGVARRLLHMLDQISVRTDVQIETPTGAVALAEYAQGNSSVLIRTKIGPRFEEMGGYYE